MAQIKLGDEVKDAITGFRGIVTARASYITGCDQVCVQPMQGSDGTVKDAKWFDDVRVEYVGSAFDPGRFGRSPERTDPGAGDPPPMDASRPRS